MWYEHIQSMLLLESVRRLDHQSVQSLLAAGHAIHAQTALVQAIQMGALSMVCAMAAAGVRPEAPACKAMAAHLRSVSSAGEATALRAARSMVLALHHAGADFSAYLEDMLAGNQEWFAPLAAAQPAPQAPPPAAWGVRKPIGRKPG